jgi:hypothetical protein
MPTDLARGLLSKCCHELAAAALGGQLSFVQAAHRTLTGTLAVTGFRLALCPVGVLLGDVAWTGGRCPAPPSDTQDADAAWPENAGLPRYAVRSMGHHPR